MGRALKYDIPGEDFRRPLEDLVEGGVAAAFAPDLHPPLRLVVEIGFGRGEFLLDLAHKDPQSAFLGVEVSFKRCLKMARRLARTELRNVRLVQARGQELVSDALAPGSVAALWVNFSDPWPKDRHAERRLLRAPFVADVARTLAPGGRLHVATDATPYAEEIDAVLRAEAGLENLFEPEPWRGDVPGRLHTAYEETWRQEGRPLYFFEYGRRCPRT